jgi:hypothetical protein
MKSIIFIAIILMASCSPSKHARKPKSTTTQQHYDKHGKLKYQIQTYKY